MPPRGAESSTMSGSQPYTYVLLRYRHDLLAEEFVNVGVVLHAPASNYLSARVRKTVGRLTKMFPSIVKSDLTAGLSAVERGISALATEAAASPLFDSLGKLDAGRLARRALAQDESSYIWSSVRSGITRDPAATLEKLYNRFVAIYDEEGRTSRDDAAVWAPVREQLSAKHLLERLQPKVITSPVDEVEFESAWKNGAWHCYQALSFDLSSPDGIRDKAARWSGHMLGVSKADESVKPYFIVGAPSDPDLLTYYKRAVELLKASECSPQVFEEADASNLVDQIEKLMRASDLHSDDVHV